MILIKKLDRTAHIEKMEEEEQHLTLIEHLEELRLAIIRSLICLALLYPIGFYLSQDAILFLKQLCPELKNLYYIHLLGLFFTRMKLGLIIAIFFSLPYVTYQMWRFVSPGLHKNERFYICCFAFFSSLFFTVGAAFALFVIFPAIVSYSSAMGGEEIKPMLDIEYFFNLAAMMMLGFGLVFQLPIIVFILVSTGMIQPETLSRNRPIIYVVVFVLAAILTPPDMFSQLAMGIPAVFLFEASFVLARLAKRREKAESAES